MAGHITGFDVHSFVPVTGEGVKGLTRIGTPYLLLVCLDRLPSHGHAIAYTYHERKATRHIPIVFVGGLPEKANKIRAMMPGAAFCTWASVSATVAKVLANPGSAIPSKPAMFADRPMYLKLGLKEGMRVALLAAPKDLTRLVPDLPFELDISEEPGRDTELTLWFVRAASEVEDGFGWIVSRMRQPRVWVFYLRKNVDGTTWTSLSDAAKTCGLGQFKILRLDEQWTGVAFGRSAARK